MKKTALITGGNKGIGLETTKYFLERNHDVIVLARDFNGFPLLDMPGVKIVPYDLGDIEGIPALVENLGPIDVLVNNAGVLFSAPIEDYPAEKMELTLKINLQAPIALMREVGKGMANRGTGRIVNVSSIAGHIGHPDVWYAATKAGLINATKSFSKIYGPQGVIVNAVAPSPVETEMLYSIPQARRDAIKKSVISGRFATALEIASAIGWLGTESPEYLNGTCMDLNNGAFPR